MPTWGAWRMGNRANRPLNSHKLTFADFTIDLEAGELHKNGSRVRLQDQPFQLLALLTQRTGEVVTREELREHLWSADTFVDFDNSLNAAVAKIREALADSPDNPRFIETLPRRGYRFIGNVMSVNGVVTQSPPTTVVPVAGTEGHRQPWRWILAAVALAGVAAVVLSLAFSAPRVPKVVRYVQLTNDGKPKARPVSFINILATDGSRVYFARGAANGWEAAQVSVNGGETVAVPAPFEGIVLNDISRDHFKLLIAGSEVSGLNSLYWVLPLPGGPAERLGDVRGHGASWSSDGKFIAYCKDQDLYVANADGSQPRKLASFTGLPFQPVWSPDGERLRFYLYDTTRDSGRLWQISVDGSNPHPLFPRWHASAEACCGVWTPDGKYFVFQATHDGFTGLWVLSENFGALARRTPEPEQLTSDPMNFLGPLPSPDGKRLYAIGEQKRGELMRYDSASRQFVTYLSGASAEGLDFSHDGEWLLYTAYPEGTLWRCRIDGTQRIQLTGLSMQAALPRWSPDGKEVAFMAKKTDGPWKINRIPSNGGRPEELVQSEESQWDPNWSPKGDALIYGNPWWSAISAIHLLDIATRHDTTLPDSQGLHSPRWSPDGRFVAAVSNDLRRVVLFDFFTQHWQQLALMDSIGYLAWSRKGEYLYFDAAAKDGVSIYRVSARDHKLVRVTTIPPPIGLAFGLFGPWTGLGPDDVPLLMRDTSVQEIYALDLQLP